jgi:hypothetical protein
VFIACTTSHGDFNAVGVGPPLVPGRIWHEQRPCCRLVEPVVRGNVSPTVLSETPLRADLSTTSLYLSSFEGPGALLPRPIAASWLQRAPQGLARLLRPWEVEALFQMRKAAAWQLALLRDAGASRLWEACVPYSRRSLFVVRRRHWRWVNISRYR